MVGYIRLSESIHRRRSLVVGCAENIPLPSPPDRCLSSRLAALLHPLFVLDISDKFTYIALSRVRRLKLTAQTFVLRDEFVILIPIEALESLSSDFQRIGIQRYSLVIRPYHRGALTVICCITWRFNRNTT